MSVPAFGKTSAKSEIDAFDGLGLPGDLMLICSDAIAVRAHSQILMLSSSVLRSTQNKTLKVEGTSTAWKLVLEQLYPLHPRPELTVSTIQPMLRIVHPYAMDSLMESIHAFLRQRFPAELSPDPTSPGYVMSWLQLADELQLVDLRHMCMCKLRSLAYAGTLENTLLQRVAPVSSNSSSNSSNSLRRDSLTGAKRTETGTDDAPYMWHQDDRPELHDSLRQLSRSTLEELLASLAMAASKRYQNRSRSDPAAAAAGPKTAGAAAAAEAMVDF